MKQRLLIGAALAVLLLWIAPASDAQKTKSSAGWKAGLAKVIITPESPVWLAGYAARTKPSEGKIHDLYAKALALEDVAGRRVVIVTSDLLGFPRGLAEAIAEQARKKFNLPRSQLVLTSSHTHTGPVLKSSLTGAYDMTAEQLAAVDAYTDQLRDKVVALIGQAIQDLRPAKLSFGRGEARFAVNRRQLTDGVMRIGVNEKGPVEWDVPVLSVQSLEGSLRGVLFGYACHNTTLTGEFYEFSGDYAGFAQAELEQTHPGAQAMFVMGCGADANPNPRSSLELARRHGAELAQSVEQVLKGRLSTVGGPVKTAFEKVTLPLVVPTREEFQSRLKDQNVYRRRHAERMLARLDRDGRLISEYPYPIQVMQFGNDLTFIAMGGEVVVDYLLRLKRELGANGLWVAGYSNDVMAYIPSVRILKEGGYEANDSMLFYDLPGPWDQVVEEKIISRITELARRCGRRPVT
ncbi:MAG TPA: neutral/alkaline non-lysosomal ceramidase N-terminal domain-containing protein [Blastocatellia bacterium]|nr:neutral/alkaline non-lysosomal ceramidase N-terminal domain-containing protein [Blastocatellia bacterium]